MAIVKGILASQVGSFAKGTAVQLLESDTFMGVKLHHCKVLDTGRRHNFSPAHIQITSIEHNNDATDPRIYKPKK